MTRGVPRDRKLRAPDRFEVPALTIGSRCQLSPLGYERNPTLQGLTGTVLFMPTGTSARVQFDGRKTLIGLHLSYLAAIGRSEMTTPSKTYAARPWTQTDDDELRTLVLRGLTVRSIGVEIGRTETAVRTRARRLKLVLKKVSRKHFERLISAANF